MAMANSEVIWNRNYEDFLTLVRQNRFSDHVAALEAYFVENPGTGRIPGTGVIAWLKQRLPSLPKRCYRSACGKLGAFCQHTQTGHMYCTDCAVKINRANPEVRIPDFARFEYEEVPHTAVKPGDRVSMSFGIVTVRTIEFTVQGCRYEFQEGQPTVTVHEHQTMTVVRTAVSPDTDSGHSNDSQNVPGSTNSGESA